MRVHRPTVAAAMLAGPLLVGCTDPDQPTDLRKDGPPNVTVVTVMSDLESARLIETATYCRIGDDKRPGRVGLPDIRYIQVCPDDLTQPAMEAGVAEGSPPRWWVRVIFDELLDPTIEDIVDKLDTQGHPTGEQMGTFRNTQPVVLRCDDKDVAYDGYYVPNGNRASWPLGPSLYIEPLSSMAVATGASCSVSVLEKVHNKAGQSVSTDQRDYQFRVAAMTFRGSDPDPGDDDKMDGKLLGSVNAPVAFSWSAALQHGAVSGTGTVDVDQITATTVTPEQVHISSGPNLNISASNLDGDPDPAVCTGGGTMVGSSAIRVYVAGTKSEDARTRALVLNVDLRNSDAGTTHVPAMKFWAPSTTYRITVASDTAVAPAQGGDPGKFPDGYSLCFHTPAAPM